MFFRISALARERFFYGRLRDQIEREVASGQMGADEASVLLERMALCDGYADMQVGLVVAMVSLRFLNLLTGYSKIAATNLLIEQQALHDPRVSPKAIHAPGMMLLRLIPLLSAGFGVFAIARIEPGLWNVMSRYCEWRYERLGLGFLNRIFVRPTMRAFSWIALLDWSDLQLKHA